MLPEDVGDINEVGRDEDGELQAHSVDSSPPVNKSGKTMVDELEAKIRGHDEVPGVAPAPCAEARRDGMFSCRSAAKQSKATRDSHLVQFRQDFVMQGVAPHKIFSGLMASAGEFREAGLWASTRPTPMPEVAFANMFVGRLLTFSSAKKPKSLLVTQQRRPKLPCDP